MANVVVWAEIRRGAITAATRHAVGEARRVASALGATVYTLMAMGMLEEKEIEGHAGVLGEAGADRILCCADPCLAGPVVDATAGAWLAGVARRLRPVLTLFPAGSIGPALGPPLALRLDGLFHPRAALNIVAGDEIHGARLSITRFRGDGASRILEAGRETPIVATLPTGLDPGRRGRPAREVEMLPFSRGERALEAPAFRELASEVDEFENAEMATALLALGSESPRSDVDAVRAAAPPGALVIREDERVPALDFACPAWLLVAAKGPPSPAVRRSIAPGTRVAVVGAKRAEKDLGRVDIVWRPAGGDGLAALASALGGSHPAEDAP